MGSEGWKLWSPAASRKGKHRGWRWPGEIERWSVVSGEDRDPGVTCISLMGLGEIKPPPA